MPACGSDSQNCSRVSRSTRASPASEAAPGRAAPSVRSGVALGSSKARKLFEIEISRSPLCAAAQQLGLGLRGRVEVGVDGQEHVADAHQAQPPLVGGSADRAVVEHPVGGEVVLPVPAARDRLALPAREVVRLVVAGRGDDLDAEVGGIVAPGLVQERDHGLPVRRRLRLLAERVGDVLDEGRRLPGDRDRERQHAERARLRAAHRDHEREQRRAGVVEHARGVAAERRREQLGPPGDREVGQEEPGQRPRQLRAAREHAGRTARRR